MGDDNYKENFVKCYICGNDVHIIDAKVGLDGTAHKDCAIREFRRDFNRNKSAKNGVFGEK